MNDQYEDRLETGYNAFWSHGNLCSRGNIRCHCRNNLYGYILCFISQNTWKDKIKCLGL